VRAGRGEENLEELRAVIGERCLSLFVSASPRHLFLSLCVLVSYVYTK
jgi:hypothetical protein